MKKTLLQKAKTRIHKLFRPKHSSATRAKKGLLSIDEMMSVGGFQMESRGGLPIENARACRGKTGFPRPSRSKYHLDPVSNELNVIA